MWTYILKRLIILLPTLGIISLIFFFISINSPGDPALQHLEMQSADGESSKYSYNSQLLEKSRQNLGLNKADFYFSFGSSASAKELNNIPFERERKMVDNLSYESGQPNLVKSYYESLKKSPINTTIYELLGATNLSYSKKLIEKLPNSNEYHEVVKRFSEMQQNQNHINRYLPTLYFHGTDNQYHMWVSNLLKGDLGISYRDGQDVSSKIARALKWTLGLSIAALIISYFFSILFAVIAAYFQNTLSSLFTSSFLMLYSIPTFIVATFFVIFLGSNEYLDLFPVFGVGNIDSSMGIWEIIRIRLSHLILPVICLSYISIAFLYLQVYTSITEAFKKDYIIVAKAKGLSKYKVITKHALRNSLLPLITYLSSIFPAIVGGSFVVEYIFSIPGMGMLTLDSIFTRDYPSIFAILLLVSFLGLVGSLVSDILLTVFDPRINLAENKNLKSAS